MNKETNSEKVVVSAQQAEELKMKEKRKREREVRSVSQSCAFLCTYKLHISLLPCILTCLLDGNIFGAETYA